MAGSTYKIIELVGTSDTSWEEAAKTAVETAGESLRDLRVAEITKFIINIRIIKFRKNGLIPIMIIPSHNNPSSSNR